MKREIPKALSSYFKADGIHVEEDIDWGKDHDLRPGSVSETHYIEMDDKTYIKHLEKYCQFKSSYDYIMHLKQIADNRKKIKERQEIAEIMGWNNSSPF